ncbi:shikimate dehydrogenase [Alteromonas gracilis]
MRCAVLGSPIGHSLSPVLHREAYAALGLDDWRYDAVEVEEADLAAFVAGLGEQWRGLSLTMPLKRAVLPLLDEVSETARRAGAANTVLLDRDGTTRLIGDNTDVPGAIAAIRERWDGPVERAVVIGGGATAGSLVLALEGLGCGDVRVLARSAERAAAAVAVSPIARWEPLTGAPVEADLVCSTIPAAAQEPALVDRVAGIPAVFEVVYDPWPTPLAEAAVGRVLIDGLDLLVHQAALQVRLMTGREAPVERMRAAGRAALGTPPAP